MSLLFPSGPNSDEKGIVLILLVGEGALFLKPVVLISEWFLFLHLDAVSLSPFLHADGTSGLSLSCVKTVGIFQVWCELHLPNTFPSREATSAHALSVTLCRQPKHTLETFGLTVGCLSSC